MEIQEIREYESFLNLETEWNSLLSMTTEDTVFLRHEWFRCWWNAYGKEKEMLILLAREGEKLIGIAPLMKVSAKIRNFSVSQIQFIENKDSPICDFIIPDRKEEVLEEILKNISKLNSWDTISFGKIPRTSKNYLALNQVLRQKHKRFKLDILSKIPFLSIHSTWSEFYSKKPRHFKKEINYHANKIKELGKISVVENTSFSEKLFSDLLGVTEKSWKFEKGVAIDSDEETKNFFYNLTRVAAEKGWLSLWMLNSENKPVAMEYNLRYTGKVFALRGDYDERYQRFSPGNFLSFNMLKSYFSDNISIYELGPGFSSYKTQWANDVYETYSFTLFNKNVYSLLLSFVFLDIIPFIRKFRK